MEIDNKIPGQEAYAKKIREMTLKEKRESYLSGNISEFRTNKNIKVLIVPGHDNEFWGTENEGVKEVDLNRELGVYLYDLLKKEPGFSVAIVSNQDGYTKTFDSFFEKNKDEIKDFMDKSKSSFLKKIEKGEFVFDGLNFHNEAPKDMATRLYGINMWVNENEFDLVIHIHFNDYAGRYKDKKPKYNGFSIYIPDNQFKNHSISKDFAESILKELSKIAPISNLKQEKSGIVEDQELIAIGANDSLERPSLLVEYGYIYEKQFIHPDVRSTVLKDLAQQTYVGIKNYFGEKVYLSDEYFHSIDLKKENNIWNKEIYMLQKKLSQKGFYPPKGKTLNDCPMSGFFGDCTNQAVIEFQKENKLPATGFVGVMTRNILNRG